MQVENKTAIITGGASGLGFATAQLLLSKGVRVAVFDMKVDGAEELLEQYPNNVALYKVNVTDESSVSQAIDAVIEKFSRIDICINCAGIAPSGKTVSRKGPLPLEQFNQVLAVNVSGTFNVLRLAAAKMIENEPDGNDGECGVIVNTASIAAFDGQLGQAAYGASKAAVVGMTLPIARDLADYGIRIATIAPGIFETPMLAGLPDKVIEPLIANIPFPKRLGKPEDYAHLAIHIIENAYINGEVIRLDGAIRMQAK